MSGPWPEHQRCQRTYDTGHALATVRCQKRRGHEGPHANEGPSHYTQWWDEPKPWSGRPEYLR